MTQKIVTYLRVSTARQGRSGLGLEAQRAAVLSFLNGGDWSIVKEFVEVESGKKDDRVELGKALALCRVYGAKLVVAKIDRLTRDVHFLTGLQKAGVPFIAADMPEANEMTIQLMVVMAEQERRAISARTKAALGAAKARGTVLGGKRDGQVVVDDKGRQASIASRQAVAASRAADLLPTIRELQAQGITSLPKLAKALMDLGITTARGGSTWTPTSVARVLAKAA